jgi:hypothetical protein
MQSFSDRHATQIFGLAMGAVFVAYADLECSSLLKMVTKATFGLN